MSEEDSRLALADIEGKLQRLESADTRRWETTDLLVTISAGLGLWDLGLVVLWGLVGMSRSIVLRDMRLPELLFDLMIGSVMLTLVVWCFAALAIVDSVGESAFKALVSERGLKRQRRELLETLDARHGLTMAQEEDAHGALTYTVGAGALSQVMHGGEDG